MSNERKLHDAMVVDDQWREAAQEMLAYDWDISAQAECYGTSLANQVIRGVLSARDLKLGVVFANQLDREAVEVSDGDIATLGKADQLEAVARRIVHHAGKTALDLVGSRYRLTMARADYTRRQQGLRANATRGLFQLEERDLKLQ